jgi:hypothetical protein
VVHDSVHQHTTEPVDLSQIHVLQVLDSVHRHVTDPVALSQVHVLMAVLLSFHGHTSEHVVWELDEVLPLLIGEVALVGVAVGSEPVQAIHLGSEQIWP